jgi:hypothetical protein
VCVLCDKSGFGKSSSEKGAKAKTRKFETKPGRNVPHVAEQVEVREVRQVGLTALFPDPGVKKSRGWSGKSQTTDRAQKPGSGSAPKMPPDNGGF